MEVYLQGSSRGVLLVVSQFHNEMEMLSLRPSSHRLEALRLVADGESVNCRE